MAETKEGEVLPKKRKVGRPKIKYTPEMADITFKTLAEDLGIATVCARLNVTQATFRKMLERHPDLKESYELGLVFGESHLEQYVREILQDPDKYKNVNTKVLQMVAHNKYNWPLGQTNRGGSTQVNIENMNTVNTLPNLSYSKLMEKIKEISSDEEVVKTISNKTDDSEE